MPQYASMTSAISSAELSGFTVPRTDLTHHIGNVSAFILIRIWSRALSTEPQLAAGIWNAALVQLRKQRISGLIATMYSSLYFGDCAAR